MLRLTWFQFTFFNSLMIVLLNFNLFYFVYEKNTQNWFITFVFIVAYFALVHVICSLLFIKFFTKFFSILFIISSFLSVYFISFYGVLIDSDMIQNVVQTDIKEVKDLLNLKLILFIVLALLLYNENIKGFYLYLLVMKILILNFTLLKISFKLIM